LFVLQIDEFLTKYYPTLLYTVFDGGILVHKKRLPKKYVNLRRYNQGIEWQKGMRDIGELLDYPCVARNGALSYDLTATFHNRTPAQIFGNIKCTVGKLGEFMKLANKYEDALKKSIDGFSGIHIEVSRSSWTPNIK
jgi:hypothetical protein